jgi:hypothetical protein
MSNRRYLYLLNKDEMESSAVSAAKRRQDPFVILVIDLNDETGFRIAAQIAGQNEVEHKRRLSALKKTPAVLIHDSTVAELDPLFPQSKGWGALRDEQLGEGLFRVVIIGDGGFSFVKHRLPY